MTYDLFISYKSEDRDYAERIRDNLLSADSSLSIFWSENTIDKIGISDYSQVIEDAIMHSKNMLVVGTTVENITSKWVSYEWRLFRHYQLNDKESFYKNLFLALGDRAEVNLLPGALQICECLKIDDYQRILKFTINNEQEVQDSTREKRGFELIQSMLDNIGWKDSIFLTATRLSQYESSIQEDLQSVTIISHSLSQDSPGGALFETVENNLLRKIEYNYIFLDSNHSYGILRKIINGHSEEARKYLKIETAEDSFWALGSFANITIYEFKNRSSEGYLRVSIETTKGHESPVYLKVSESFVDNLWNHIEQYRLHGLIKEYSGDHR